MVLQVRAKYSLVKSAISRHETHESLQHANDFPPCSELTPHPELKAGIKCAPRITCPGSRKPNVSVSDSSTKAILGRQAHFIPDLWFSSGANHLTQRTSR